MKALNPQATMKAINQVNAMQIVTSIRNDHHHPQPRPSTVVKG